MSFLLYDSPFILSLFIYNLVRIFLYSCFHEKTLEKRRILDIIIDNYLIDLFFIFIDDFGL